MMTRRTLLGFIPLAAVADLPAASHAESAEAARAKVAEMGGLAMEIAQNDDRLEVSLRGVKDLSDDDLAMLAHLPKTAYLRLGGTDVGDGALRHAAKLEDLVRLGLENTKITNAGLAKIKGLSKLESLNLYGTDVGDEGLAHLAGLSSLKRVYVWQTKVTDAGVAKLQQALPELQIDRGWELPPGDTKSPQDSSN